MLHAFRWKPVRCLPPLSRQEPAIPTAVFATSGPLVLCAERVRRREAAALPRPGRAARTRCGAPWSGGKRTAPRPQVRHRCGANRGETHSPGRAQIRPSADRRSRWTIAPRPIGGEDRDAGPGRAGVSAALHIPLRFTRRTRRRRLGDRAALSRTISHARLGCSTRRRLRRVRGNRIGRGWPAHWPAACRARCAP
jgi:hypothetical protein